MASIDRLNGLASETTLAIKAPCVVATTGSNITLAGVQAIDGVTVGNNYERVLVKDQADQTTNGIYIASSGNWTYAQDAGGNTDWSTGTIVAIMSGTVNAGSLFNQTAASPITIGTSPLTFALYAAAISAGTGIAVAGTKPSVISIAPGFVKANLKAYGTVGLGGDDTAAFIAAAAANPKFYVPPGSYNLRPGLLTLSGNGCGIEGDGPGDTLITITGTSLSGIALAAGATQPNLRGFTLTRSGVAIATGTNLDLSGGTNEGCLEDLVIKNGYINLALGPTDSGRISRVTCGYGQSHGIFETNTASSGSLQWQYDDVLATQNAGYGRLVQAANTGPAQITLGECRSFQTFANTLGGQKFAGLAGVPINAIRLLKNFCGADGGDGIYLDTYNTSGGGHFIDAEIELCGTAATGPTLATPASNAACGIKISANNGIVLIPQPQIMNVASDGIQNGSTAGNYTGQGVPVLIVGPGAITNVGQGGNINLARGIANIGTGGLVAAAGGRSGNLAGNTTQEYGITLGASTDYNVVRGWDVTTNQTAGLLNASTVSPNHSVIDNCPGYNPVGVTAAANVGASPATITAGNTPETHYVNQSATNTATIAKGGQKIATLAGSSTYYTVELGPNESYVVTWTTTAPTYTKDVH